MVADFSLPPQNSNQNIDSKATERGSQHFVSLYRGKREGTSNDEQLLDRELNFKTKRWVSSGEDYPMYWLSYGGSTSRRS